METATFRIPVEQRIAVVTGGNRGIGLEICRQLALNGIKVILTARDEKKGMEALAKIQEFGFHDAIFHQLDLNDSASIDSLAEFIRVELGRLDILVNNAAISGFTVDAEILRTASSINQEESSGGPPRWLVENLHETYELAEECLKTNYHGTKNVTDALIPLLRLSNSGRIVSISSDVAQTKNISHEELKQAVQEIDSLSEERLGELSRLYLKDFRQGFLDANKWPPIASAYSVSKVLINAYMRLLAEECLNLSINCVDPGFVNTDMNYHTGILSVEEGAKGPVSLALRTDISSGQFFNGTEMTSF